MPIYSGLFDLVGNTPVVELRHGGGGDRGEVQLFAKLEGYNPTGSIKDRPAAYIIRKLLLDGEIDRDVTIIESSSGNFGVALAAVCRTEGLRFICVVDPLILPNNRFLIEQYGAEVSEVTTRDDTGGYLKARIARVKELEQRIPRARWINQYANPGNASAHYYGTGMEIYHAFSDVGLDYVLVPVSSGGTITGISQLLKSLFPRITVIAVDTVGSVIFGGPPNPRYIPGMGSSIKPELLRTAMIDHVVMVSERDIVSSCNELLRRHGLFVGGSSGAAYRGAQQYFQDPAHLRSAQAPSYPRWRNGQRSRPRALLIFPDRGDRYQSTIYDQRWVERTFVG